MYRIICFLKIHYFHYFLKMNKFHSEYFKKPTTYYYLFENWAMRTRFFQTTCGKARFDRLPLVCDWSWNSAPFIPVIWPSNVELYTRCAREAKFFPIKVFKVLHFFSHCGRSVCKPKMVHGFMHWPFSQKDRTQVHQRTPKSPYDNPSLNTGSTIYQSIKIFHPAAAVLAKYQSR